MFCLDFCLLVHRDIAARNVLLQMVDSNIVAKIGDFVSRVVQSIRLPTII